MAPRSHPGTEPRLLGSGHGDRRMAGYVLDRLVEAVVYGIDAEETRGGLKIRRSTEVRVTKGGYSGSRNHALARDCSRLLLTVSRVLPLKRNRGSHAVAQRHSRGCYLPAHAMATPSISIPSTPTKREKERARDLCAKIEALSKQVPCIWIRLRTELQENEVAEEFFRLIGVPYQKNSPFREEAVAIFPNYEKLLDIEGARRERLLWVFNRPTLFGEALSEQRKHPGVKTELKVAVQATVGRKGLSNEARKQYMEKLLPSRYSGGLVIADESKRQFLQQMDITKFRTQRWPQLVGQHIPFLKWRLAVV